MSRGSLNHPYLRFKRAADVICSCIALLLLSPLFLLLSVMIKCDSKGPVLFKQKRTGINRREFYILKFRTMRMNTPHNTPTHLLAGPERFITRTGRFLRKTSLDELPQIINILKGDMSIVGPRPALWNQYDLIAERDRYGVNNILPGLTGLAQINGRDDLEIPDKVRYDAAYMRNMGLCMDLRCMAGTVAAVLHARGVTEGGRKRYDRS